MNLETKITIYKFTPQLSTLTRYFLDPSGIVYIFVVLVLCSASIWLNIRLATRMQQLQDNDIKYRFLLMQGWVNGEVFDILDTGNQIQQAEG